VAQGDRRGSPSHKVISRNESTTKLSPEHLFSCTKKIAINIPELNCGKISGRTSNHTHFNNHRRAAAAEARGGQETDRQLKLIKG
jgi:hypothetical protein